MPLFRLLLRSVLPNLQFPFKFICPFIISECAFLGDEVKNLLVFTVLVDMSSNQLSISNHAPYGWPTLKQKIPLAFNLAVHLFLFASRKRGPVSTYFIPYEQLRSFLGSPITQGSHKFLA